jgi:NAD(P)-dependent dehydrogenase (short-subunit alcohol dehydrogenase family)
MLLENKVIVITGAGSGIGKATAQAAAAEGALLALCDISESVREVAAALGDQAMAEVVDIANAGQVEAFMQAVAARFGRIDGLFNNAGVGGTLTRLHRLEQADWDQCIAVNLTGVWLGMKYAIPHMGSGSSIVNMASAAGIVGFPNNAVYSATKHGVIGLTKSAGAEYARAGIRVNAVCPGYVETPMVSSIDDVRPGLVEATLQGVPMRRLGRPSEVADVVTFLLSERSSFMTGASLSIDGGSVIV